MSNAVSFTIKRTHSVLNADKFRDALMQSAESAFAQALRGFVRTVFNLMGEDTGMTKASLGSLAKQVGASDVASYQGNGWKLGYTDLAGNYHKNTAHGPNRGRELGAKGYTISRDKSKMSLRFTYRYSIYQHKRWDDIWQSVAAGNAILESFNNHMDVPNLQAISKPVTDTYKG